MIVAITGGTGFIGAYLVGRHLERQDTVRILTRGTDNPSGLPAGADPYVGDLTGDPRSLIPFVEDVDILYHCAGEVQNESLMESVHVGGTYNLLQAARGRIGRWVQLSSTGVYGPQHSGLITEDAPLAPQGIYEVTKAQADRLVVQAAKEGWAEFVILRPTNVFGPGMRNKSLYQLISILNRGLFFFIGSQGASANYIHVANVVEALYLCAISAEAVDGTYIVSDWRSIEQFVATICRALGRPAPRVRLHEAIVRAAAHATGILPGSLLTTTRVDALTTRVRYPIHKIQAELNYREVISMEDGLSQLVASWKRGQ